MINVVLAAGYATRLGELTKNFPKPLLRIGNNTILGRMLDDIDAIDDITEHVIVTNHKFAPIFDEWVETPIGSSCLGGKLEGVAGRWKKPITIIDDGSTTNDNRLGAVCDLLLVLKTLSDSPCQGGEKKSCPNREDLGGSVTPPRQGELEGVMVVAADNLLFFSFQEFVDFAKEKQTSCIMCHEQPSIEKLQRTGVVELDADMKVLGMEEKPQVPKSHWAVPPFYIYRKEDLELVRHSVENGCGKDAPGNLAHYMVEHTTMHAWPMSAGRFDIGSLDTYYEAVEKYG
ncbi:MAG: NTP transferase domain-containing protein [Prevotella sp.]|nr:NTP transferase domain-containing protein [Prevotella sp.]